jgi:hypothetical protein
MNLIISNDIWELIDRPYRCKPVSCKWVFKKKLRSDGTINKYKARLVTRVISKRKANISLILIHLLLD